MDSLTKNFLSNFDNHLIWHGYDSDWNKLPILQDLKEVNESAVEKGYGTFFTINGFDDHRTEKNIKNLNACFGDFDAHCEDNPEEIERKVQSKLKEIFFVLEPTYVIRTKNGIHVYWLLDEKIYKDELPEEEWNNVFGLYKKILDNIKYRFDFDKASSEPVRILRVPGYPHQKNIKEPFNVSIIHQNESCRYSLRQLSDVFQELPKAVLSKEKRDTKKFFDKVEKEYPRINRPSTKALLSGEEGTLPQNFARHTAAMIAAIIMRDAGVPKEEALIKLIQTGWHGLVKERPKDIPTVIEDVYEKRQDYYVTDNVECISHNITKGERENIQTARREITASEIPPGENEEETEIRKLFIKSKVQGTYALAEYLTKKFSIITIGEKEREMYVYRDGMYKRAENEIIYPEIQRVLKDSTTKSSKLETFHKIADMTSYSRDVFTTADVNLIPLKNGVYDMVNDTLLPHSAEYRFTYQFPIIYDKDAICPKTQEFMLNVLGPDQLPTVEEWIGYYFYRMYSFKKAIIFVGEGDTGKTTLLEMIINLLGKENISSVSLQKMTSDKFAAAHLYEKHGNIVDELSARDISDTGNFKIATGGGSISGEYKFGNQFSFCNFSKFTFACNKIPDVKDFDDEAYFNRWMVIRFENIIAKKIPNFIQNLTTEEERSGLFNLAMTGLRRLLDSRCFTYKKTAMDTKLEMMRSGSSIAMFAANKVTQEVGYEVTKEDMYDAYTTYCSENGLAAETMDMFGKKFLFYVSYATDGLITLNSKGKRARGWRNIKVINVDSVKGEEEDLVF